jgi:CheY-like chemotaxis protein
MDNSKIICLIEDDPIQIFLLQKFFEYLTINNAVIIYKDGKEAYDMLKARLDSGERMPDYILLDINMPIWDGWQFLAEFHKLPGCKAIPTYILTSSSSDWDRKQADKFNLANQYIVKPIQLDQLKAIFYT